VSLTGDTDIIEGCETMSIDDLNKLGSHITKKKQTTPLWREHALGEKLDTRSRYVEVVAEPKRTWSHKNIIPNMKKTWGKTKQYGVKFSSGYTKMQSGLANTFPGIANGTFDREVFGFEQNRRKHKK